MVVFRVDLRPVDGVVAAGLDGVVVVPFELVLVRMGVDLEDGFGLEAKYAELVVSSSSGAGAGVFFFGVVDFFGFTTSSSSSSSETTLRALDFFPGLVGACYCQRYTRAIGNVVTFSDLDELAAGFAPAPPPPKKLLMSGAIASGEESSNDKRN